MFINSGTTLMPNFWKAEIICRAGFPFCAFARMLDKRVNIGKIVILSPSPKIIKARMTPVKLKVIKRLRPSLCSSPTNITQGVLFNADADHGGFLARKAWIRWDIL